ncbi:hypothetical protein V6Z12_A11G308300 [Gossypium hirsutum]
MTLFVVQHKRDNNGVQCIHFCYFTVDENGWPIYRFSLAISIKQCNQSTHLQLIGTFNRIELSTMASSKTPSSLHINSRKALVAVQINHAKPEVNVSYNFKRTKIRFESIDCVGFVLTFFKGNLLELLGEA